MCQHDILAHGTTMDFMERELARGWNPKITYMGDSDSALVAVAKEVDTRVPNSKWVLVERQTSDAMNSYKEYFGDVPYSNRDLAAIFSQCSKWCEQLKATIGDGRLLVVPFQSLDDINCVNRIWGWCCPLVPFNRERAIMLQSFSINVHLAKNKTMEDCVMEWRKKLA